MARDYLSRRHPRLSKNGRFLGRPQRGQTRAPLPLSTRAGRAMLRMLLETGDKLVLRPWGGYTCLKSRRPARKNVADTLIRHGFLVPTEEITYVYRTSPTAGDELRLAEGPLFNESPPESGEEK